MDVLIKGFVGQLSICSFPWITHLVWWAFTNENRSSQYKLSNE